MKKVFLFILLLMFCLVLNSCEFGQTTTINEEPDDMQYQIYKLAKASSYTGTYEEWLESIRGDEVELKTSNDLLMWKYKTESEWRVLYDFTSLKGEQGPQGEPGVAGENGTNGKSAYELAKENGFEGSLAEWIASLKGETGAQGEQGIQGLQGEQGVAGQVGANGKSAYEIFKENYPEYTGTEKEWVTAVAKGDVCALFGHEWDEGVITTDAQIGIDGEKTYICSICGEHKYEVIPMIVPLDLQIYTEDGISYVNFGKYPQTHVSDETIINALNQLTETNEFGYYEYDGHEYAKVNYATPAFSSYVDNFGQVHYCTYSDGVEIQYDTTEYFLVEPIKWRILESNDGEYLILTDKIIDQSVYYINKYDRRIDDEVIRANNYKYSTIRHYISNDLYNRAFNESQKGAILTVEVDNSESSTQGSWNQSTYQYVYPNICENTYDKMFLLSYQEANELFDSNQSRVAKLTDYVISKGAYYDTSYDYYGNGYWWLRSPSNNYAYLAYYVSYSGNINTEFVNYIYYGVRLTCIINLQ